MWGIELQRGVDISLSRQIYQALRDQMTDGRLRPNDPLPSTRELAKQLAVSRNTTYEAYEMLTAEGYIVSRQGSQTRVANGVRLEKYGSGMEEASEKAQPAPKYLADFRTGQPDLERFPRYRWLQLLRKATEDLPLAQWSYTGPEGFAPLRQEIAAWLLRSRGIRLHAQDVFITAGATQALHLLAELLSQDGRKILVEDPCHIGMLQMLQGMGVGVRPVPVDEKGIKPDQLDAIDACAVYTTPSHQFPLGGILPADRRADLIRFARISDLYLIEDDYDSEFRYGGAPVAPLLSMDRSRVIYVGTFSKVLFPALRIGYVILPRQMQARWCTLRTVADMQNPPFEQAALAEYLRSRKLDRHIQEMRRLYGQRRQALMAALRDAFGDHWRAYGDAAGLHVALEFPGMRFDAEFMDHCLAHGVLVTPVENHSIVKGRHAEKLLLGYGHLEVAEIRSGVALLREIVQQSQRK